jgi:hypothetical protein
MQAFCLHGSHAGCANRPFRPQCKGYYEPSSLQISIQIRILGVSIGSYTSNLNNVSLSISININAAKGHMKCYRRNNDIRIEVDIRNKPGHGDQHWQWDEKILDN